jgi:hypothetical protein
MKQSIATLDAAAMTSVADLFKPRRSSLSLEKVLGSFETGVERKPTVLPPALQSALAPPTKRKATMVRLPELSQPKTLTLEEVEGALTNFRESLDVERVGTITITLPFGLDHQIVNAATFKALAGREGGTLLRQAGERWEIVEDDEPIDLGDRTRVFKLGRVQIYS